MIIDCQLKSLLKNYLETVIVGFGQVDALCLSHCSRDVLIVIYKSLRLGGPINDTIRSAIRKMKEKDSSGSTKLSPVEFKYYLENHVMEDLVKRFEAGSNYTFEDEGGLHLC